MQNEYEIVESTARDVASIVSIYPLAFPDEDLVPLVRELLDGRDDVLSLVAIVDSKVVGHVAFTNCRTEHECTDVSLLAPLAVSPDRHKQGIGSALVRAGFDELERAGVNRVFVLGDPAYYGRFGFEADNDVEPPYPLPPEWQGAWQSFLLGQSTAPCSGKLFVPPPWQHRSLWAP